MVMRALWYHHFLGRHSRAGPRWLSLRNMWPTPPLALGRHPATGYPHMPLQPGTARHSRSRHFGGRGACHPGAAATTPGLASTHTRATHLTPQSRPRWVVRTRASQCSGAACSRRATSRQSGWLGAQVVGHAELRPADSGCVNPAWQHLAQPRPTLHRRRAAAERSAPARGLRGT